MMARAVATATEPRHSTKERTWGKRTMRNASPISRRWVHLRRVGAIIVLSILASVMTFWFTVRYMTNAHQIIEWGKLPAPMVGITSPSSISAPEGGRQQIRPTLAENHPKATNDADGIPREGFAPPKLATSRAAIRSFSTHPHDGVARSIQSPELGSRNSSGTARSRPR
jgi:hypothetical protein